jgi:hypothetical protein
MSIKVWHQPESGRIASKLQVVEMENARGVCASGRVGVSARRALKT